MTFEDQHTDLKSLRTVTGRTADWDALAKDCVCFANGAGGCLLIGIEYGEVSPPVGQTVPAELLDRRRKRIGERRWRRYRLSDGERKEHEAGNSL